MVERRRLVEAAGYLVRYVNHSAPFGVNGDLAGFLIERLKPPIG
ncbi:hypothetical protein GCM10020218_008530 [Dactylosporangium vinaceum]